jgi:hypothetical protein
MLGIEITNRIFRDTWAGVLLTLEGELRAVATG